MQNVAYRLSLLTVIGGLVLLMIAERGSDIKTPLGVALIGGAVLLAGIGKLVDLLGYVEEGATEAKDEQPDARPE